MKTMPSRWLFWMPALLAFGLMAGGGASAQAGEVPDRHTRYVFGLSPFLDDAAKDEVYRGIVRFVLEGMPMNSSAWLFDAYRIRTIVEIEVPAVGAFRGAKTRANQFKDRIHDLRRFLAATHERPEVRDMKFDQAVRLPQFLDFVGNNLLGPNHAVVVVILGGPLYLDDKEPAFAMVSGYFPSDGHLLATQDKSVFGVKDRGEALEGLTVHWGYFGDPWVSEIHQQKVARFWALLLKQQGARLATFTGDLPTVFNAVRGRSDGSDAPICQQEIDPTQTKVEMLRITRDVGVTDWITRDLPSGRQGPPSITVGPMKIGIRWQGNLDLDLYARPKREAETLFFKHTRSAEGYYLKDHRSSPDREYEFIEFLLPVDVWQMEAFVNFYAGEAPRGPEGEIRVEFDSKIYSSRFAIPAEHGNKGRAGDSQSEFWVPVDVPKLLGLR